MCDVSQWMDKISISLNTRTFKKYMACVITYVHDRFVHHKTAKNSSIGSNEVDAQRTAVNSKRV